MQQLKLWYNKYRNKIWITVGIIAAVILLIQLMNFLVKNSNNEENSNAEITDDYSLSEARNETGVDLESTQSALTGEKIQKEDLKTETETIGRFFDSCNQGNIEEAYDLLTKECKDNLYSSKESFEQSYYKNLFSGQQKIYTVENWTENIYRVNISENMLATGKNNDGYVKQDYVSVEKENNEYKLNINSYIRHREINKTTDSDDIEMLVLSGDIYMEHEEYKIRVTNNREETIKLDAKSNVKSLHLEDDNGENYSAYTQELTDPMIYIEPGRTKELTIKFYSRYVSSKNIKYIVFSDLLIYKGQGSEKIEFKAEI